jgi:hypothetical protein
MRTSRPLRIRFSEAAQDGCFARNLNKTPDWISKVPLRDGLSVRFEGHAAVRNVAPRPRWTIGDVEPRLASFDGVCALQKLFCDLEAERQSTAGPSH